MHRPIDLLVIACLIGAADLAFAEPSSLTGTYSGTFTRSTNRGPIVTAIQLEINQADGDAVTATAKQGSGDCQGTYSLEGKREGDHLTLHAKSQDARAGCTFDVDVTIQGQDLVGKKGQADIKLSR